MKVAKSIIDYSNSAWTYQSAEQYDKYYSGGTRSMYNYLYNNKITSHDFHIIQKAILKVAQYKDSIDIMDFGCGNGRHQVVYESIASSLEKKGKKINLIAYEISKTALEYYINMLLANGFWESDKKPDNNKIIKILTKNNITVHFFYANIQDNLDDLAKLIGKLDITFSIFGVLAHIQTRALRQNTMSFLGNITTSEIILSLPGRRVLLKEQQAFKTLREGKFNIQIDGQDLNLEEGDLLYSRNHNGVHIENFFHIYHAIKEIEEDARESSLNVNLLRINKILSEALLLKYPLLSMIDEYIAIALSYILPNILKEKLVSYYLVSVSKQK
ncbi:hypothetical protein NOVO_07860 [Rickettsiales bacterium Ac37b]|nr:hypothetical protein NOVO_07860 [Rickettsiales bacterium Ac37b]